MSKLIPKNEINAGVKFENWKDWADFADVKKALDDIGDYMSSKFPNLQYAVSSIETAIADVLDKRDKFRIIVYTNSDNKNFESLWFYYLTESKTLIPYFEFYFIRFLADNIYPDFDSFMTKKVKNNVYFAMYNEEDREDGNPWFEHIDYNALSEIKTIPELLKLHGEYSGDGCVEVRIRYQDGDETSVLYSDNDGYYFLD